MRNKDGVLQAMKKEIGLQSAFLQGEVVRTIYFGGGTPSVLSAEEINSLITAVQGEFDVLEAEVTLEANPDDLDQAVLDSLKNAGINRLSIGIQSFHDKDLVKLNRSHDGKKALQAIELSRQAGFNNINIDLIYGLPDSGLSEWNENLDRFFDLDIPHLSAYSLTYEDKTAFGNWLKKGRIKALDEEVVIDQFSLLMERMKQKEYRHYEISNFSLPGMESRHNTSYWKGEKYLGIGPSAHSFDGSRRRWNLANNARYVEAIEGDKASFEEEVLTEKDRFNERLLTSLRTSWGLDLEALEKDFGKERAQRIANECMAMVSNDLLIKQAATLILSEKGKLVADKITSDLFEV